MVSSIQAKIKSYKKQIEEAEEIAALNLAKFRQVQGNVCEAQVINYSIFVDMQLSTFTTYIWTE